MENQNHLTQTEDNNKKKFHATKTMLLCCCSTIFWQSLEAEMFSFCCKVKLAKAREVLKSFQHQIENFSLTPS